MEKYNKSAFDCVIRGYMDMAYDRYKAWAVMKENDTIRSLAFCSISSAMGYIDCAQDIAVDNLDRIAVRQWQKLIDELMDMQQNVMFNSECIDVPCRFEV